MTDPAAKTSALSAVDECDHPWKPYCKDCTPPTGQDSESVETIRDRHHQIAKPWAHPRCADCGPEIEWPCDTARLLATLDAARIDYEARITALEQVAGIVQRHTHQGMWAMTRHAGEAPESDCQLCRALVAAGVLTLDDIGAGTRAALLATPPTAVEPD